MQNELIPCARCGELERFLEAARQPGSADLLAGLSEAGKRNRVHQTKEKIERAEQEIAKHQKQVHQAVK